MAINNKKLTIAHVAIAKRPKSKATALRWYLKDHIGLLHNQATDDLRDSFVEAMKAVKGRNAQAIVQICRECVGGSADGNCRQNVRNCEITDCLLFNVRPYQSTSKVSLEYASPRAFSSSNVGEVIERLTPTKKPLEKSPLQHSVTEYSSVEVKL
jgi:hypothetical protein